jgi:mono/diheme cytochrome c family protein
VTPAVRARRSLLLAAAVALGVAPVLPFAASAADDAIERFDYTLNCAGCHRADGRGSEAVPSLTDVGSVLRVEGGRAYLARVPGVAQAPLSDERLARLLDWIVVTFGGAEGIARYSAEEVGALRSEPLRAPERERERLLGRVQR